MDCTCAAKMYAALVTIANVGSGYAKQVALDTLRDVEAAKDMMVIDNETHQRDDDPRCVGDRGI